MRRGGVVNGNTAGLRLTIGSSPLRSYLTAKWYTTPSMQQERGRVSSHVAVTLGLMRRSEDRPPHARVDLTKRFSSSLATAASRCTRLRTFCPHSCLDRDRERGGQTPSAALSRVDVLSLDGRLGAPAVPEHHQFEFGSRAGAVGFGAGPDHVVDLDPQHHVHWKGETVTLPTTQQRCRARRHHERPRRPRFQRTGRSRSELPRSNWFFFFSCSVTVQFVSARPGRVGTGHFDAGARAGAGHHPGIGSREAESRRTTRSQHGWASAQSTATLGRSGHRQLRSGPRQHRTFCGSAHHLVVGALLRSGELACTTAGGAVMVRM